MNRETAHLDHLSVSEEFLDFSLFCQLESFKGPKNPKEFVSEYIEAETASREEEARKDGALPLMQPSETIRHKVTRSVSDYVSLIARVSDFVCYKVSAQYEPEWLSVVQIRTRFDFSTWVAKILFIIDADPDGEREFLKLLRHIEKVALEEERFTTDLDAMNRRNQEIDFNSLWRDYPFIGRMPVPS